MSRFFDLLQRLNQQKGNSAPASLGSDRMGMASDLDQSLSLLLPTDREHSENHKNGSVAQQMLPGLLFSGDSIPANPSEFQQIAVEEVRVQPASRIVFHTDPNSPAADRFRFLRMRLRALWNTKRLRTLLVTSPLPEDGKSTIALNLATALAEGGKRTVLLIEGDLHRSPLTQHLGLEVRPGLAECLERGLNPVSALRRLEPLGWYVLPAGHATGNPTELLQSEALPGVMQALVPYFDWILIDSPPVIPLTDALSLGRHANASLLVARAGQTPKDAIEKALGLLGREHIVGVVLNGVEELDRLYSGYYSYSGHNGTRNPEQSAQS